MLDKRTLTMEELDRQMAMELPQRDTMLVTVVITNVLNDVTVSLTVEDVEVAAQICAAVLTVDTNVTCTIDQS